MKPIKLSFILLILAGSLAFPKPAHAQYAIQHSVFGNGGAVIQDSTHRIASTVGQPMIGEVSDSSHIMAVGFWYLPGPLTVRYGDVDGDGDVDADDAARVLQAVVSLKTLSADERQAADVTGNDDVTALDAALILQYSVGLISEFPVETQTAAAPALTAQSEAEALMEEIARLERASLTGEPKEVLEQLKRLVFQAVIPKHTRLLQNYPNPFNPETWIPYQLAKDASVSIRIYDLSGKLVRTLDLGVQPAGVYRAREKAAHWDGRNRLGEQVSSGIYFYTMRTSDFYEVRKLMILK